MVCQKSVITTAGQGYWIEREPERSRYINYYNYQVKDVLSKVGKAIQPHQSLTSYKLDKEWGHVHISSHFIAVTAQLSSIVKHFNFGITRRLHCNLLVCTHPLKHQSITKANEGAML